MAGGSTVIASDGVALPIDNLPQEYGYDAAFLSTVTVVYRGVTYIQTYTNDGTNITAVSLFVAQE